MKNGWKRFLAGAAAVWLTVSAGFAEEAAEIEAEEIPMGSVTEKDGWHFDEKGFLTGENPGEEYLLEDAENGKWEYSTADLSIRVTRYQEEKKIKAGKRILEYCIAEVYASETSPLFTITTPATSKRPTGYNKLTPEKLVENNPVVLAVSDDYYGHRMQTRASGSASWPVGIIIRNGELLSEKTRNSQKKRYFPPLDTLAVYGDGSMKAYLCDELTAEQYVEQGATQVFAFGPWLIRDGEINEKEAGPDSTYHKYSYPRIAVGMIEPYHYILIAVKGEPSNKYIGVRLDWLAAKMKELGCVEALNMDGGGTASMIFNGKTILQGKKAVRPLGSMIAFGKK